MGFEFDCIITPINHSVLEIESLNRYLFKELEDKKKEYLLEKNELIKEGTKFSYYLINNMCLILKSITWRICSEILPCSRRGNIEQKKRIGLDQ